MIDEFKVGDIVRPKRPDVDYDLDLWEMSVGKYRYKIVRKRGDKFYLRPLVSQKEAKRVAEDILRMIEKDIEPTKEKIPHFIDVKIKVKPVKTIVCDDFCMFWNFEKVEEERKTRQKGR